MNRTNTRIQTTTPVSDCTCKAKAGPRGKVWTPGQTVLLDRSEAHRAKLGIEPKAIPTDIPQYPRPTIHDIRHTHGDCMDFLGRWLQANAPADVYAIFDQSQALWFADMSYRDNGGQISPRDISERQVMAAIYAAKAGPCALDPDLEVDDE